MRMCQLLGQIGTRWLGMQCKRPYSGEKANMQHNGRWRWLHWGHLEDRIGHHAEPLRFFFFSLSCSQTAANGPNGTVHCMAVESYGALADVGWLAA